MLRKSFLVGFSILALACAGFAAGTRVALVGVMSDSHCGLKHAQAGPDVAKCVIGCVAKGADYVVVSEGKIYKFEKKNDFYKNFAGKNVEVVGNLTGETFGKMDLMVAEITGAIPKNLHVYAGTITASGGKYTLESEGKVYKLDTETMEDKGAGMPAMAGRSVEVVGSPDGNTIHLREVQTR